MQKIFFCTILIFGGVLFLCSPLNAETIIRENITTPTTWTKDKSPYHVIAPISVNSSLNIESEVTVRVETAISIFVNSSGSLKAENAVFSSTYDDEHGGVLFDTPSVREPSVSHGWGGINSTGELSLRNNKFFYGGRANLAFIEVNGGTAVIEDNQFQHASNVYIQNNGIAEVKENDFTDIDQNAVWLKQGVISFGSNEFIRAAQAYVLNKDTFTNTGKNSGEGLISLQNVTFTSDKTLVSDELPYRVGGTRINANTTLTIEAGSILKVINQSGLTNAGTLKSFGTKEKPIIFTSLDDDSVGGDSNKNGNATAPSAGRWGRIHNESSGIMDLGYTIFRYGGGTGSFEVGQMINYGKLTAHHSVFSDSRSSLFYSKGGLVSIEKSEFARAEDGILSNGLGEVNIHTSDILDTKGYRVSNSSTGKAVNASNNYWGNSTGPVINSNDSDKPRVTANVIFEPYLGDSAFCKVDCFSNVLFLPGIKASRLYEQGATTENQLWEPTYFDTDLEALEMDEEGKSIRDGVYTRGVIEEQVHLGTNIYKSFINDLEGMKTQGIINEFNLFAYDWRYDVRDIVEHGTRYQDTQKSLITETVNLADASKSEKVTIVAHSNGGILAKALLQKLESLGLADKVDTIIFLGSPQMGTPAALLSFLYGYDEGLAYGTLVSRKEARSFVENVPGAYSLLPSQKYFDILKDDVIQFDDTKNYHQDYKETYGANIASWSELEEFLTAKEGREKPASHEIEKENILNTELLQKAKEAHDALDAWSPPSNIKVIQIAGTGLDTVSGVKYTEKEKATCFGKGTLKYCKPSGIFESIYEPIFSKDGDKVVTTPSALMLPIGNTVQNYFVDMKASNTLFTKGREHKNITEIESVRNFMENAIQNNADTLPKYISTTHPNPESRLRMRMYSPVDVHLYDTHGNHTGPKEVTMNGVKQTIIEENIPNSYYYQFGERKYIGFPSETEIKVNLKGYAEGSYTLEIDEITELSQGVQTRSIAFENLPSTPETTAALILTEDGLKELPILTSDINGDNVTDYGLIPVLDGKITLGSDENSTENLQEESNNDKDNDASKDDNNDEEQSKDLAATNDTGSTTDSTQLNTSEDNLTFQSLSNKDSKISLSQKGQESQQDDNPLSSKNALPASIAFKGVRLERLFAGLRRIIKFKKVI